MAGKSRREEYALTTRAAIVEAAAERFAVDGFAGTNIESIAERARVTKGAVYHHFADKADLFEAVYRSCEERLVTAVIDGVGAEEDPWTALETGIACFLDICCDPTYQRLALAEPPIALGWQRWKQIEAEYFLGLITSTLVRLGGLGVVDIPDPETTGRLLLAALDDAGMLIGVAEDSEDARSRAGEAIARLLLGLRCRPLDS